MLAVLRNPTEVEHVFLIETFVLAIIFCDDFPHYERGQNNVSLLISPLSFDHEPSGLESAGHFNFGSFVLVDLGDIQKIVN